jgi:carbonic anhydrase
MSAVTDLLERNRSYAENFDDGGLASPPAMRVAIVTCMDCRLDPARALGLELGDAHVIRNAGGVVGDDVIRSLSISQHHLGTEEVAVIHHTGCGLMTFTDEQFADDLERETGQRPAWSAGTFADLEQDVRAGVRRILDSPFVPRKEHVRGYVYEVETGRVREVAAES